MEPEIAIRAQNLSKKFRVHRQRSETTLKSYLLRDLWRRRSKNTRTVWAIRDVDFEVPRGGTLGLIGRNGSGKSTLLRLLNRTLWPDAGSLTSTGKVAALIELGVGFHPELSGRENALINGIVLGLSKREVRARLPEIIDFAEIGESIDEPVRTYSTGMVLRLGFSVASMVDPEILLLDEFFAVGDSAFNQKCFDRMNEFKKRGCTIVIASHDLSLIRAWCDRALWLESGHVRSVGAAADVVDAYIKEAV